MSLLLLQLKELSGVLILASPLKKTLTNKEAIIAVNPVDPGYSITIYSAFVCPYRAYWYAVFVPDTHFILPSVLSHLSSQ